jgi:UDP-N-acetylglucosamine diphosphorylase/glucosamine-1-phosphate N-acetyltransferase
MILYDELVHWQNLLPLTYTRSIAECRVGILTIQEKWEHVLGQKVSIEYAMKYLETGTSIDKLRVVSNVLPTDQLVQSIQNLSENQVLYYEDIEIASYTKGSNPIRVEFNGSLEFIQFPWHIFLAADREMRRDYELLTKGRTSSTLSKSNAAFGDSIFIEEGAKVNCAILNAETGPIYIGKNAEVMEGSMIRGPFSLGENAQVKMGAKIYGATAIGPGCKVGGEITNSIFFANSNKAHDGYIGNSIIGEWCNLGADTNSSNLKNNYDSVDIYNYTEANFIASGQQFLGLILGDHSKSSINTMFNTGTVVGVCANIVGTGFPNKHIPSFSWCLSGRIKLYDIEKALETIRIIYGRRGKTLDQRSESILRHIHSQSNTKEV